MAEQKKPRMTDDEWYELQERQDLFRSEAPAQAVAMPSGQSAPIGSQE